jgi:hypothetical protein
MTRSRRTKARDFVPPRIGTERDPDAQTLGPQIGMVSARLGQPFMPHQQHVMDIAYEIEPSTGQLRYDEVIWTIMRQSGKTTGVRAKSVWRCTTGQQFFGADQVSLYLAQTRGAARRKLERDFTPALRKATAAGSFTEITNTRARPQTPTEWKLSLNNGQEHLLFGSASYLQIDAPNREAGHGDTIDDATIDEAFAHQSDDVEQSVEGTNVTRTGSQLWVVSTAGDEKSTYLWPKVRAGRKMIASGVRSNVAYLEWSLPDDADIGDEDAWWEFMPALGRTISVDTLRRKLAKARRRGDDEGEDVFRRTNCNQWVRVPIMSDDDQPQKIAADLWLSRTNSTARHVGDVALGVDTSTAHRTVYLTVAGQCGDGRQFVEVIHEQEGRGGIESYIDQAMQRYAPVIVAWDNSSQGGRTLAPQIMRAVDERAALMPLGGSEWAAACEGLYQAVVENRLCHLNQDTLTFAVEGATEKHRGQSWVWDRLTAVSDISPLCGATAAHRAIESYVPPVDDEEFYVY